MKTNGSDCSTFSKSNGTMTVDPEKDLLQVFRGSRDASTEAQKKAFCASVTTSSKSALISQNPTFQPPLKS